MILGMGIPELAVILLVVLVVFGPKNLPKIGSALGKTVRNVREGMEDVPDEGHAHDDPAHGASQACDPGAPTKGDDRE